ncbi:MAG: C25 family cysteine peptidase [Candidatus Altiarchaeota archaeon]
MFPLKLKHREFLQLNLNKFLVVFLLAFLTAIHLNFNVNGLIFYTCSSMKPPSCMKGTCPIGYSCELMPSSNSCTCMKLKQVTSTTTIITSTTTTSGEYTCSLMKPQFCSQGICPKGEICILYKDKCTCTKIKTFTTITTTSTMVKRITTTTQKTTTTTISIIKYPIKPIEHRGCFYSIGGKIMNFTYHPKTLSISLCEVEKLSSEIQERVDIGTEFSYSPVGITPEFHLQFVPTGVRETDLISREINWVCKRGTERYVNLSSHNSYKFENLCLGVYMIVPFYQKFDDVCEWRGNFWNRNLTFAGFGIVNLSNENSFDFIFKPIEVNPPEVDLYFSPINATTKENIELIVKAFDDSGIKRVKVDGLIKKIIKLRGHCRNETVEIERGIPEIVEVCDEEEFPFFETFSKECYSDLCSYSIPKSEPPYERYEIYLNISSCDNVGNMKFSKRMEKIFSFPVQNITSASAITDPREVENSWNLTAYRDREVFLVPDTDWKLILSLMPIVLWPSLENSNADKKYPLLIYHQEPNGDFDIDSAIEFMKKYKPKHVTIFIPNGTRMHPNFDDVLAYWLRDQHILDNRATIDWYNLNPSATIRFFEVTNFSVLYDTYFSVKNYVIVVENNYTVGLNASLLSGFFHLPIYFEGFFTREDIANKTVTTIGNLNRYTMRMIEGNAYGVNTGKTSLRNLTELYYEPSKTEHYSVDGYIFEYTINRAGAKNRKILINPLDIENLYNFSTFVPRINFGQSVRAFGRNSLAAPYLAIARRESFIFFSRDPITHNDSYCGDSPIHLAVRYIANDIIEELKEKTHGGVLTIISDPRHVLDSYYRGCSGGGQERTQIDRQYNENVGRIYGITVTDTSSYIARSVFYNELVRKSSIPGVGIGLTPTLVISHSIDPYMEDASKLIPILRDDFGLNGWDVECYIDDPSVASIARCYQEQKPDIPRYLRKRVILFLDHGWHNSWAGTIRSEEIPDYLDLPIVFGDACLTNNFWVGDISTLGLNWIRHGAIAYFGAAGVAKYYDCLGFGSYYSNARRALSEYALGAYTLGSINQGLNHCVDQCLCCTTDCSYRDDYLLLGDPLLKFPRPVLYEWEKRSGRGELEFELSAEEEI